VLRRLGRWFVVVALVQVVLLVVGPWLAVRYVDAPWAAKYAAAATLWGSRVLVPILVMGALGLALAVVGKAMTEQVSSSGEDPAAA